MHGYSQSSFLNYSNILQQLEEEVKRLKAKITEQEVTLSSNANKYAEHAQLEGLVKSLKTENMQCDGKIRDLQAELVSLYAKSPEVRNIVSFPFHLRICRRYFIDYIQIARLLFHNLLPYSLFE